MIWQILAGLGWLAALVFGVIIAVRGLRGGPVRLPFRGGGGMTLTGLSARIVGVLALLLALLMLSVPFVIILGRCY